MSARPGQIEAVVNVDIPHPREVAIRRHPRFAELVIEIGRYFELSTK
jgi:hypothetical protein